ncbi:ribosomal protein of the large subunit, mitochondrial precursor, putative [Candida dubliniensis CD36]|uniref:Large ribosomal subunit protein uL2m n=1 Tax=Candida dubliniensis (strain CD36 / ATCC MYA-646 / CBS 7987 / NCPF 3949 / NRRL Y-17841) TaxID=573826 RepID=B9WD22_CANDC|nr:mitochondrial 54S ribosomal protein RML2 [Candida dubliniensis CD36]CAX42571.1 ribosomal protein of the large subunit, mitochondrial precursor, putative [Candida dubliniensis CD36]
MLPITRRWLGNAANPAVSLLKCSRGFIRFNSTSEFTELELQDIKYRKQRELSLKLTKMKNYGDAFPVHSHPGSTHYKKPVHDHLHKGRPVKELTVARSHRSSGRNNEGKITVRGRGGGHKKRARLIDFHRWNAGRQEVVRIEYDPNRSGHIALLKHLETGDLSYILAPQGLRSGDIVESFRQGIPKDFMEEMERTNNGEIDDALLSARILQRGNCLPLRMLPVGSIIHNIGLRPGDRAQLVRSAGTFGKILSKHPEKNRAVIKLSSGEQRYVILDCHATLGVVSNKEHQLISWGKAGRSRYRGFRPKVRGVAMNACDHPHGGGRGKSKSNKVSQSMWGLKKFQKTRLRPNPDQIRNRKGHLINHDKFK